MTGTDGSMITRRIKESVKEQETQMWRALKEAGKEIFPYLAESGCVIILHDGLILTGKSLKQHFKGDDFIPWLSFDIQDMKILEVDLMAAVAFYNCTASRMEGDRVQTYELAVSSTWKQLACAEWKMSSHQQTLVI